MAKEYTNGEVTITWNPKLCVHSGECVRGLPEVFQPKERPWIKVDQASSESMVETVKKCPSGALGFYYNNEKEAEKMNEKEESTIIKIRKGGSTLITGKFVIEHADGTKEEKTKCALCRCGGSANMPFCDGSHNGMGFEKE